MGDNQDQGYQGQDAKRELAGLNRRNSLLEAQLEELKEQLEAKTAIESELERKTLEVDALEWGNERNIAAKLCRMAVRGSWEETLDNLQALADATKTAIEAGERQTLEERFPHREKPQGGAVNTQPRTYEDLLRMDLKGVSAEKIAEITAGGRV